MAMRAYSVRRYDMAIKNWLWTAFVENQQTIMLREPCVMRAGKPRDERIHMNQKPKETMNRTMKKWGDRLWRARVYAILEASVRERRRREREDERMRYPPS